MTDYDDSVAAVLNSGRAQAVGQLDADPDAAARSIELSNATGVPSTSINGDLEGFEKAHKAALTGQIIAGNPQLSAYVRSHPLAAQVSNDDYGALDQFSQGAGQTSTLMKVLNSGGRIAQGVAEGAREGFGSEPLGQQVGAPQSALGSALNSAGWVPLDFLMRGVSAIGGAISHGAGAAGTEVLGPQFGRDIQAMTEYEMSKGEMSPEAHSAAHAASPWLNEGMEPPRGVHPVLDKAKAAINAHALEGLEQDLQNSELSTTKARSPEMFSQFVRQHYGNSEIGIHGDAALALYGDKQPAPGDGLLGWVPGIADKLAIARETGADVKVPTADWISNVDPAVASGLHDDIRMWPGGLTAREGAVEVEPKATVDSPLTAAREQTSTEPLHGIGDRKLEFDGGQIKDGTGAPIGTLDAVVEDGDLKLNGMSIDPETLGPSAAQDLYKQLALAFPEAGTIAGRPLAASGWDTIEAGNEYTHFRNTLEAAHWKNLGANFEANFKPLKDFSPEHQALAQAIHNELLHTIGNKADIYPVAGIRGHGINANGLFMQYSSLAPKIFYDLFSENPLGTARHEGIHMLRQYGMFSEDEWATLSKAAKDEKWGDRYQIAARYDRLGVPEEGKIEESIAEAYRDWAANRKDQPVTPVTTIFQKMQDLWEKIKAKFGEILGRGPSAEDIFEHIYQGDLSSREAIPINEGVFRAQAQLPDAAREQIEQMKASAAGLDQQTWRRLQKLIQSRFTEDVEAATSRAAKEEARRQTKEWRDNEAVVRKEVDETIRQRPDVAADLMLGKGELFGEKLDGRPKLLSSDLTDEQKKALPRRYYSEDGLPTDVVANLFGYGSGDTLVAKLGQYTELRGNLSSEEMVQKVIKDETARQMEQRYGRLQDNIMQAAQDHALSSTNLDLMSEEMKAAAQQAGTQAVDSKVIKQFVKDKFAALPIKSVDSGHFMDMMGRHGKDAEKFLIGNDPASAVVSLQKKYTAALFAAEARKLEKEVAQFDKVTKGFARREITGMEPEYTNFIHQVMGQIGKRVNRSVQDLAEGIAAGSSKSIEEFQKSKEADLREMPVWPQLYDTTWKKQYQDLTTEEFRSVRDTIKTMAANGRDERRVYKAGEALDLAEAKSQLTEAVERFPELTYNAKDERPAWILPQYLSNALKNYIASSTQIETLLNRWDKNDPKGPWNQIVMRDLIDGANQKDAWIKEYAKKLTAISDKADLSKQVDNPIFRSMIGAGQRLKLTRGNLRAIMLNVGNDSNLTKLAVGRGLKKSQVMDWIHTVAKKEDWEFVQKVWDLFGELKAKSDTMYRSLSGGVAPESIEATPVVTPHGTYRGGYYPVIYAEEGQRSKALIGKGPLEEQGYVRATTPAGYTQQRTGYVGPVALDLDRLPNRMKQVIHDTALRPAILNASKILYDPKIQATVSGHYGKEYKDLLVPYLRDVANNSNFMSKAQQSASGMLEFTRQNMIGTLVGLNPHTVLKHGPTAFIQSINEVGAGNFLSATKGLLSINDATGETNWQFAMANSQELQRRHQHYQETISGAVQSMVPSSKFESLRRTIMKYGSYPVAMSDLLSAVPTWSAAYKSAIEQGGSHGDGVYEADRAIRRAHGSSAITSRPSIVRDSNPWFTSVYGFFSHILNRQMEMVWKAGEMTDMVKEGQYASAFKEVPKMAGMIFAYAIAPALIEQIVSGQINDNESWAKKAGKALLETGGASWVGVRDFTSAIVSGRDPTLGLGGTALKTGTDLWRDFGKKQPFNKEHAGRLIQDASGFIGTATGLTNETEGRAARFALGVHSGIEHPKGPWDWVHGLSSGTLKEPRR
jgi:hypothetical protein